MMSVPWYLLAPAPLKVPSSLHLPLPPLTALVPWLQSQNVGISSSCSFLFSLPALVFIENKESVERALRAESVKEVQVRVPENKYLVPEVVSACVVASGVKKAGIC